MPRMMRPSTLISNCWLLLFLLGTAYAVSSNEELQTYIIHMDHSQKPNSFSTHELWHRYTLRSLSESVDDKEMLLYSYNHVMHGFSARLTKSQLAEIQKSQAHVATYQESFGKPLTTYSTKFLGLTHYQGLLSTASDGEGVIIGILDTGIWPESESFRDMGMAEVPLRWKGKCENGTAFSPSNCNRKLIGARSFSKGVTAAGRKINRDDYDSPRDFFGHGSHTSSTAAGNYVPGASHYGYARGTARGVAPRAYIAMYKVLFAYDTTEIASTDVLAGMDQAIADGVDIMSLSIGLELTPYYSDVIAIASLSAIEKGIFVVCAAGNEGSYNSTFNGAPWITTVGAGTLDRSFTATMTLENGVAIEGTSYYPQSAYITNASLYYGQDNENKSICYYGALNKTEVHRKIVFCDNSLRIDVEGQKEELERVGAYAGILTTNLSFLDSSDYTIPVLILPSDLAAMVKKYITGVTTPKVKVMSFLFTKLGTKSAPQVAYFSSRGPDPINPSILKPDILAPGADILAAMIPNQPFMDVHGYGLGTDYVLLSGTSMATPHVAGVAALLKSVHPEWSPAAIRSAIMTTAYNIDNTGSILKDQFTGSQATPLDFGSGHIQPNMAMNPGLIYDLYSQDYINFICSLGYTDKQISAIIRRSEWNCRGASSDLNYPSFMSIFNKNSSLKVKKFSRIVTNVGDGASVYKATLETPPGMRVNVEPSSLYFGKKYRNQGFSLRVEIDKEVSSSVIYGYLKWTDQHNHVVSSPIVVVNV